MIIIIIKTALELKGLHQEMIMDLGILPVLIVEKLVIMLEIVIKVNPEEKIETDMMTEGQIINEMTIEDLKEKSIIMKQMNNI